MRARIIFGSQMADLAAFMLAAAAVGVAGEANPIATALLGVLGLGGLVVVKTGGALALAYLGPRLGRWWLLPAVAGLFGAATAIRALL